MGTFHLVSRKLEAYATIRAGSFSKMAFACLAYFAVDQDGNKSKSCGNLRVGDFRRGPVLPFITILSFDDPPLLADMGES